MKLRDILKLAKPRIKKACSEKPGIKGSMAELLTKFRDRFSDLEITHPSQLQDLCHSIDEDLEIPEEVEEEVTEIRTQTLSDLISALFKSEKNNLWDDNDATAEITRKEDLTRLTAKLVPIIRKFNPSSFNQKWISENAPRLIDKDIKFEDWALLKQFLPQDLRNKFILSEHGTHSEKLLNDMLAYKEVILQLGPEAVAQYLISIGQIEQKDFERALKIITKYLGRYTVQQPKPGNIINIPPDLLKSTSVNKYVFIELRKYIYRKLLNGDEDISIDFAEARMGETRREIKQALGEMLSKKYEVHRKLFDEILAYYEDVFTMKAPENMQQRLKVEGEWKNFPSLRQRIAMKDMKDKDSRVDPEDPVICKKHRSQLIEFFMDKGKTATAFLTKEHVGAKKMLYCCPPKELVGQVEERVHKYYKAGQEPTVGAIKSQSTGKIKRAELLKLLEAEVVILPYSMFGAETEEGDRVIDIVKQTKFDFLVADEAHYAKNEAGRNTKVLFELATEIEDLYEKGYIQLLTADSTPNSIDDIISQLRIWDKDQYSDVTTLKAALRKERTHPLILRNALHEFLLRLDKPPDWEQYSDPVFIDLLPEERQIYNIILDQDELEVSEKIRLLYLCVLNSSLFTLDKGVKSAVEEEVVKQLDDAFLTEDTVVVAENMLAQGITRPHETYEDTLTVAEKLEKRFKGKAEIYVLDGQTKPKKRKKIFEIMKKKDGVKRIIFVHGDVIRHGIDLSHINRAILLEPTYNKADTIQLLMRFPRQGNKQAKVTLITVMDTIMQGILEHSDKKYDETTMLKEGGSFANIDPHQFDESPINEKVFVRGSHIRIGSDILNQALTVPGKLKRIFSYLHNAGANVYKQYMHDIGKMLAQLYLVEWNASYSANNARFVLSLIRVLEEAGVIKGNVFGDVACGPLILELSSAQDEDGKERIIYSSDLNRELMNSGVERLFEEDPQAKPIIDETEMSDLSCYKEEKFDVLNCALAFNYTKLNVNFDYKERDERVKTLFEFNRVLKTDGVLLLTLPLVVGQDEELIKYKRVLKENFGFEVLDDYSGVGVSVDKKDEGTFRNKVLVCKKVRNVEVADLDTLDLKDLALTRSKKPKAETTNSSKNDSPDRVRAEHNKFEVQQQALSTTKPRISPRISENRRRVVGARKILEGIIEEHGSFKGISTDVLNNLKENRIAVTEIKNGGTHFYFTDEVGAGGVAKGFRFR